MNEERWRKLLQDERGRVEDALERSRGELAAASQDLTSVDQGQTDVDRRIVELEERLAVVAQAEERLREGRHGRSVESGEPVPQARLGAIPAAEHTGEAGPGGGGARP